MRLALSLLALVAVVSAASATPAVPPAQYDKPYTGNLAVSYGRENVQKHCHKWFGAATFACALTYPGRCEVYLPNVGETTRYGPVTPQFQELLRRHEIGHCNGWPASHPL